MEGVKREKGGMRQESRGEGRQPCISVGTETHGGRWQHAAETIPDTWTSATPQGGNHHVL